MLSPPTDQLYKFWAILGLALVGVGIPLALNAYDRGKQAELDFIRSFEPAQRAANRYFEEVNLLKAELRKYNEKPSKEAWEAFQRYQTEHEEELNDLQAAAETADDTNQSDLRTAEHTRFMAWLWFGIGVALSCFGVASSFVGFRNWVKREAKQFFQVELASIRQARGRLSLPTPYLRHAGRLSTDVRANRGSHEAR